MSSSMFFSIFSKFYKENENLVLDVGSYSKVLEVICLLLGVNGFSKLSFVIYSADFEGYYFWDVEISL